jgi:predicted ester cyclase
MTHQQPNASEAKTKPLPNQPAIQWMNLQPENTMTKDEAWSLANHWAAAWNSHDLDAILAHYDDAVELTSPVAAQLLGLPDGKIVGKANLRAYFQRGLAAYPELRFELVDVLWGLNSVVLYYTNQKGTRTAEFMELSVSGKVVRVVANYSAEQFPALRRGIRGT